MVRKSPFPFRVQNSNNWAGRLDSRIKLFGFLLLLLIVGLTLSSVVYLIITSLLLIALFSLGINGHQVKLALSSMLVMGLLTFLLHLLFNAQAGKIVVTAYGFSVTENTVVVGLMYCWRIALFLLIALAFGLMIDADQFAEAIWRLLGPLKRLGIPADDIGLAFFIAIRFIPTIMEQYQQIVFAQRARGAKFDGGPVRRARNFAPLLVPTILAALRRAAVLGDCLLIRAWGVLPRRAFYTQSSFGVNDMLFLTVVASLAIVALVSQ